MREDITTLFSTLPMLEPPAYLFEKVMTGIAQQKRRSLRSRLALFSIGTISSMAAIIPALGILSQQWGESELPAFLSLLMSDPVEIVTIFWREFLFSIIESVPIMGLLTVSIVILFLVSFIQLLARDLGIFSASRHSLLRS